MINTLTVLALYLTPVQAIIPASGVAPVKDCLDMSAELITKIDLNNDLFLVRTETKKDPNAVLYYWRIRQEPKIQLMFFIVEIGGKKMLLEDTLVQKAGSGRCTYPSGKKAAWFLGFVIPAMTEVRVTPR